MSKQRWVDASRSTRRIGWRDLLKRVGTQGRSLRASRYATPIFRNRSTRISLRRRRSAAFEIEKPAFDRPFVRGLRELAKRDLLLEVAAHPHQLDELTAVADRVPDLTIVLEHAGRPAAVNYGEWSRGIASLAQRDNVICKLSGLGLGDKTWDRIAIADRVARCIDAFGPERSMFGSNWPIDGLFTDYHTAVEDIRSGLPAADVQQVFVETARKVYKLMLPRAS